MLNTHQEYGVTSRHIRCSSWDKRSTPYLVCIARFFFYSERKLSQETRDKAVILLDMKANKKMIQQQLSQESGSIILLKDLSNIVTAQQKKGNPGMT